MATVVYQYNAGTCATTELGDTWTNKANAFDGADDTYAHSNISGSSAEYLKGTGMPTVRSSGRITKVEIGYEGYNSAAGKVPHMIPIFGGSTSGTDHPLSNYATADNDSIYYVDITSDAAGPGTANWSWSDIQNLDVSLYGGGQKNISISYVDGLYVRVTYIAAADIPQLILADEKPPLGTPADTMHPMLQGCRLFVPFNENAGRIVRDSISGRNGNLSNALGWNGRPGWLTFDGLTSSATLPAPPTLADAIGPMTLLMQLRLNLLADAIGGLWQACDGLGGRACCVRVMADGTLYAAFNAADTLCVRTTNMLSTGVDYILAVSYDGGSAASGIRVFINGVESFCGLGADAAPSTIGGDWQFATVTPTSGTPCPLNGSLRWAAWFQRVLGFAEIRAFCREPFSAFRHNAFPADPCIATCVASAHLNQLSAS